MVHASFFTGIGGFDLAAQMVGWENMFQCEINPFCLKLLEQNFPGVRKHKNIKETDFTQYESRIDVLSGGFPCQPFSTAGHRKGTDDDRYLWPEYFRGVREIKPPWVVGENVRGLINWNDGMVFNKVCAELETEGYEVAPFLLPAAAVNAPHRRERIFFVAYSASFRRRRELYKRETLQRQEQAFGEVRPSDNEIATNTDCRFRCKRGLHAFESETAVGHTRPSYACNLGNWQDFPTKSGICRRDDGIPNRVDRIKGLGNAVVPQVVKQIFEAIDGYDLLYT
jgi:DNA (cytosine-5)-methyltransferase 1